MGLDMYLTKEVYIWRHNGLTGSIDLKDGNGNPIEVDINKISRITEDIGYWRKANQIHEWFVNNVQHGVDDCGKYWVSKEQLHKLYNVCRHVYSRRNKKDALEVAQRLLPTTNGFLFGSQEYSEYYYSQIKDTIDMLKPFRHKNLDDVSRGCDFYYQASW